MKAVSNLEHWGKVTREAVTSKELQRSCNQSSRLWHSLLSVGAAPVRRVLADLLWNRITYLEPFGVFLEEGAAILIINCEEHNLCRFEFSVIFPAHLSLWQVSELRGFTRKRSFYALAFISIYLWLCFLQFYYQLLKNILYYQALHSWTLSYAQNPWE